MPDELKGQSVVCFCVLKPDVMATDDLREELKDLVADKLGKPLKPAEVKFVKDLPKTRNPKSCAASFAPRIWARTRRHVVAGEPASRERDQQRAIIYLTQRCKGAKI